MKCSLCFKSEIGPFSFASTFFFKLSPSVYRGAKKSKVQGRTVMEVAHVLNIKGVERFDFFNTGYKWTLFQKKKRIFLYKTPLFILIKYPCQRDLSKASFPPAFSSMDPVKPTHFLSNYKTKDRCQVINKENCTQSNYCTPILKDTVPILQNNAAFSKKNAFVPPKHRPLGRADRFFAFH